MIAHPSTRPQVLVIIVLYRHLPQESAAFCSLTELLQAAPTLAGRIACMLWDNSPAPAPAPESAFPCIYHHDAGNPGLAKPYQRALERARKEGIPWLLLLDQDTALTAAYLAEISKHLDETDRLARDGIVALAPKLVQDGDVLSPHWPSFHRNRGSFRSTTGVLPYELAIYNSGSLLKVSALLEIGGFPADFPLDFLDHAVYRQLQRRGGRIWLMHATLEHHLASKNGDFPEQFRTTGRMHSIARAQSRFYKRYGTPRDRLFHLLRRVKMASGLMLQGHPRHALTLLRYTVSPPER